MAQKYSLQDCPKLINRSIFVDANVLIYLFWPTGSHHWEKNYASAFRMLLKQKNPLFVNFMVISEVINRIIRIEHLKVRPDQKFKVFRNSQSGKDTIDDIHIIIKNNILNNFGVAGKLFNKDEIMNMLVVDDLDFNDKGIQKLCEEKSMALLTNDVDFKNSGIDILTSNPKILKS